MALDALRLGAGHETVMRKFEDEGPFEGGWEGGVGHRGPLYRRQKWMGAHVMRKMTSEHKTTPHTRHCSSRIENRERKEGGGERRASIFTRM